jgi:transcriptional regulator with XRE-family HTH domain
MKLGDVLRKERERKKLTLQDVAARLGMMADSYEEFEGGVSPIEEWGPKLAQLAIKLSTPTSRLISETGKSAQAALSEGQSGRLIRSHREKRQLSQEDLAKLLDWPVQQLVQIENGDSPLETYGSVLLRFAETIDQPIFNLFYPCGLPFQELEDYP